MSSSLSHNTLVHFRFNPEHKAERGGHGLGSNCSGQAGEPTTLKVPIGTLLFDDATGIDSSGYVGPAGHDRQFHRHSRQRHHQLPFPAEADMSD